MSNIIGKKGKRIAFLGNISHKKGPMLLIHAFQAIYEYDNEFTLHIGGSIQDSRYAVYFDQSIPELNLQDNIQYHGHINNSLEWLSQFDYIICTSPLEGSPVGIIEALSCGLTPLIYSFVGAPELFPHDFIWKTISELIEMIKKGCGKPKKYKNFVKNNFSLAKQLKKIDTIIADLFEKPPKIVKNGTVSAIIAVKNGAKTIERAVRSLQKQTRKLEEIIIVDDGSTDNTLHVLQKISSESDVNCKVISISSSKWVFSARNKGFEQIISDYFFFLDADDWVDVDYVEKMAGVLDTNTDIAVVYPDMVYFDENFNEAIFRVPDFDPQILVQRNFVAYSSMQRTSKFKEIGCYSEYLNDCRNHLSEWDLWLRYIKKGIGFKRFAEPLFHYFKAGNDQMSSNYERPRGDMHLQMAMEITEGGKGVQMGTNKCILLVCQGKDYCDRSKVGFEVMTWVKPLEAFGDVYTFFYDVEMAHFGEDTMLERLKHFIALIKPTYIFHLSYKDSIPVGVWKEISKDYNTFVWHSDDDRRFEGYSKEYGEGFRHSITTYPQIYDKMTHPGKILSQWAANEHYFYPREKDITASFIGQCYGDRQKLLAGVQVDCYGFGWPNGFIDFKQMADILGRSKISISFAGGADGNKQLKLRTFEICASNTLCLCENVEGIENYYIRGEEIILFSTKEEMVGLLKYFLEHEDERKKIAHAGYERTMRDHLWKHRFEKIFI